jgi:hypothetical protein
MLIPKEEYDKFVKETNEKIKMWNRVIGVGDRKVTGKPC